LKTNHRRGYVAPNFYNGQKKGGFVTWSGHGETTLSGKRVNACATHGSENSLQVRRDKAGAKKFVRSRTRFHEKAALKKIVEGAD
jgi:hypothetical protein